MTWRDEPPEVRGRERSLPEGEFGRRETRRTVRVEEELGRRDPLRGAHEETEAQRERELVPAPREDEERRHEDERIRPAREEEEAHEASRGLQMAVLPPTRPSATRSGSAKQASRTAGFSW